MCAVSFHLSYMKKINFIFLIFSLIFLISCKEEGGGVIVTEDPNASQPPVYQGPFGGPQGGDSNVLGPSPYLPAYSTFELQDLINNTPEGGTLELDRDVVISSFGLTINKPITITSSGALKKIKVSQISSVFNLYSNNLTLRNLSFELINTSTFVESGDNAGDYFSGVTMDKIVVLLRGTSFVNIIANGTVIQNSSIIGLSQVKRPEMPIVKLKGNNISVIGNNILDATNKYTLGLGLLNVTGAVIKENVIRCYCDSFYGAISGSLLNDIVLESNILHDANDNKENVNFGDTSVDKGSIALSFIDTINMVDNGFSNTYSAQLFSFDDIEEGDSSGIILTPGNTIPAFGSNVLFNYMPTEDLTPYCGIGNNPTISLSPKNSWQSYQLNGGGTLYYSGAIKPACL